MGSPQSDFDNKSREDLEAFAIMKNSPYAQNKAQIALRKLDQKESDVLADRSHQESILESQASRRLDKWALSVAVIALLVGGAGLWRSFLPQEPTRLLPASASSVPADRVDPIAGIPSKPSTELAPKPTLPKK